jgi:hypothetical protein
MSSHYTLQLSFDLRADLDVADRQAVAFLIDGHGAEPAVLPSHRYFEICARPLAPLAGAYSNFPLGAVTSMTWPRGELPSGALHQLCLRLPSLHDATLWEEEFLQLLEWLASLSATQGFIGSVHEEDRGELTWLLFAMDCRLQIDMKPEVKPTGIDWAGA